MNLLKTIIERLNQRVEVANIFDKQFNLCELNANGNEKAWVHYIGNGQAEVVTNFDAKNGTLFWAKRGKVSVAKTDAYKMSGCKQLYVTTFPLTAYAIVRKSHLPCDAEDAQDWLASRVYKLTSGTDPLFKQSIGVINYEVVPSGYTNEIKTLTAHYEWACVSVDMDVQVITTSEDGCYDTCATGDIPLPDLQPCTPCLTEVAVDGVTIIGNGTAADPLSAIGAGGGAIVVQDEGSEITPVATTLNFTGAGVTASLTSPGVVEVNVPGGGSGGVGTLQEVTNLGNSTTNDIAFTATAGLSFDNGAFFRKGTTDAGNGGAKGTSQICSISYELKWEAGRLYYMEQDGFTIRDVTHNFTFVPQPTDDSTKGFVVGSRWSLDDGTVYLCSDATIGAAVWSVVSTGGVTSVTATAPLSSSGGTTPDISIQPASSVDDGYLTSADWNTFDGKFDVPTGTSSDYLDGTGTPTPFPTIPDAQVNSDWNSSSGLSEILNKPTIPTATSDLTNDSGFITIADVPTQVNADWNATSGFAEILNKPSIPAAQVNSDWNATSGLAEILNKPTIPVVTGFVPYTGATADLDMGSFNVTADHIALNVSPSGAGFVVGATEWNNTIGSSQSLLKGGNVTLKNGVDLVARIVNKVTPNTTLTKAAYQAVRVSGAAGQRLAVELARANNDNNSADTIGLVCETIATNQEGFIQTVGQLLNINTTGSLQGETWADGDVLYLSPTTAGALTNIKPTGVTGHIVVLGYVEYSHASNGSIYIKVMNGWELDELHNVYISGAANNEVLTYDSATSLWKNKTVASALGFTPVTNARTISTTAPLSGGGDLTANRTLAIAKATSSVDGYLAATDFTIFAAKQNAITPAALTKVDDTNVTLTLGGSPTTSLLTATSLTLGWSGTLADARIASAATWNAKQDALVSGTNIKTINSTSLLGSGNISIVVPTIYKSVVDSSSFSNTTNTAVYTQLISANTFAVGDIIRLSFRTRKTGVLGTQTLRMYVNSTADLSGTPLLVSAWASTGVTNLLNQMLRHWVIKNATTNTETLFSAFTGFPTDIGVTNGMVANAIDWTANRYIVFALQNTNATDVNYGSMFLIEKL